MTIKIATELFSEYGSLETALQCTGDVIKLLKTVFPMQQPRTINNESKNSELPTTDKFPRTQLLLSLCQMVEENYPVPLKGELAKKLVSVMNVCLITLPLLIQRLLCRYGNYILTKNMYIEASATSPMFGLDCEMCRTTSGELELTRISLVDESMNVSIKLILYE